MGTIRKRRTHPTNDHAATPAQDQAATGAIRPARLDDAGTIADVHVRSWQAAYRGLMPDSVLDGLSVEHRAAYWANTLSDASVGQRVWVAESSDHVVGFSHARWRHADAASPPGAEIAALYVLPEYWSMGLGRALLDTAVDALPRRGFETATLWVLRDNGRARRFYERAGWRVDGNVASLEIGGQAVPKVRYQLDLVRTDGLP